MMLKHTIRELVCRRALTTVKTGSKVAVEQQQHPGTVTRFWERVVTNPSLRYEHGESSGAAPLFAVVGVGGKQHKVTSGDILMTAKLPGVQIGTSIDIKSVFLVAGADFTEVGRPHLEDAVVRATIQEQTQTKKLIIFKKKRRKGYKRTSGHRTEVTIMRIDSISLRDRVYEVPVTAKGIDVDSSDSDIQVD